MKWESFIQMLLIIVGLFVGAHFSKISYTAHEQLGHGNLQGHKAMDHGILDISDEPIIPKIEDLQVVKDPMSGWNIHIEVTNFRFTPENASQQHRPGEGHAHLYINGSKVARMYNNWFHIPGFVKESNKITVSLNTNDHQTMALGNQPIEKSIVQE